MESNLNTSKISISQLKIGEVQIDGITLESSTTDTSVNETIGSLMELAKLINGREISQSNERRQILAQDHANAAREYYWKKEFFLKNFSAWEQRRAEAMQAKKPFDEPAPKFDEEYPRLMF